MPVVILNPLTPAAETQGFSLSLISKQEFAGLDPNLQTNSCLTAAGLLQEIGGGRLSRRKIAFVIAGASGLQPSRCAQGRAETPSQGKPALRRHFHGYEEALKSPAQLACV